MTKVSGERIVKKKLAISIGDLNGIGLQIALEAHENKITVLLFIV